MAVKNTNKKTQRKKSSSVPASVREQRALVREAMHELTTVAESVETGILETKGSLALLSSRIIALKNDRGLVPTAITCATNWTAVTKGLTILKNDLDRVNESWSKKALEEMDVYTMPMFCLQVADQYTQLATLLTDRFLPATLVIDEHIDNFLKDGTEATLIPIGAPTKEHHEDGTTTEHTEDEAREHLDNILNPTDEQVAAVFAENK